MRSLSVPRTCSQMLQGITCQGSERKVGPGLDTASLMYNRGLGSEGVGRKWLERALGQESGIGFRSGSLHKFSTQNRACGKWFSNNTC